MKEPWPVWKKIYSFRVYIYTISVLLFRHYTLPRRIKTKKYGKKKSFYRIKMVKTPKQISTNDCSFSKNGFLKHFKELEEIATETFPRGQKDNKYGL